MRRYPRHPSSIPIELVAQQQSPLGPIRMDNVGTGGIACAVARPLPVGAQVQLRIPLVWPDYHGRGVVVWCRPESDGYEVGIQFDADEAFKSKMVQQLCQIEEYRRAMRDRGRELDGERLCEPGRGESDVDALGHAEGREPGGRFDRREGGRGGERRALGRGVIGRRPTPAPTAAGGSPPGSGISHDRPSVPGRSPDSGGRPHVDR